MRLALIADIHANREALEAVLRAIEHESPDFVVCLGDIIGYNAEPSACLAAVRQKARTVVAGNHDLDVLSKSPGAGTNVHARQAQEWTRDQLDDEELDYIRSLPRIVVEPDVFVAVHGCYLNQLHYTGYVTSTMLPENLAAVAEKAEWPTVAFCAHTHVPLFGELSKKGLRERKLDEPESWNPQAEAVLINPGSVGQPRDGDTRACFAIVDFEKRLTRVERVSYDVEASARRVEAAGLPAPLANRLREGR